MATTRTVLLAAIALFAAFFAPVARAETAAPEVAFVQRLGDKALMQLTDKALPRKAREKSARALLRENFDVPTIARFALGPSWREATDAQKRAYMGLFEDMIVSTYTGRFEGYSGQSFKAENARAEEGGDSTVFSQILQKDGPPVNVEWRVRRKDGRLKIIDVIVESISMSVTQRSDFSAVIERGGSIDALIESLRAHKDDKKG